MTSLFSQCKLSNCWLSSYPSSPMNLHHLLTDMKMGHYRHSSWAFGKVDYKMYSTMWTTSLWRNQECLVIFYGGKSVPNPKAAVTYHFFFFLCIRKPPNCLIIGFYRNLRVLGIHEHATRCDTCIFVTANCCNFVQTVWQMPPLINWNWGEYQSYVYIPRGINTCHILRNQNQLPGSIFYCRIGLDFRVCQ